MEIRNSYIYRHIRPDTNMPFYIGLGTDKKNNCRPYHRAYRKDGRSDWWNKIVQKNNGNYEVEIIMDKLTIEEAKIKEREFIALYGRDSLCNLTDGGDGSFNLSEKSIKRRIASRPKYNKGRRVAQYALDGNFVREWKSVSMANKELKFTSKANIHNVAKGRKKSAFGFIWKYVNND